MICDNALVNGFAGDFRPIGRQVVMEVCRDFQLGARNKPPAREAVGPSALGSQQATVEPPAGGALFRPAMPPRRRRAGHRCSAALPNRGDFPSSEVDE